MSAILDEHRVYLADRARLDAFRDAISEIVKPGDVVLDLGSGTGILGLFACRAGARRVFSVESGELIGLARDISRANGFADRHQFIKGLSLHIDLPEKIDVVVCDQIGRLGPEFRLIEYLSDVRVRFLVPGGVIIPSEVRMYLVPVECERVWEQVEFWRHFPAGFDFQPAGRLAANTEYIFDIRKENLLGVAQMAGCLDLNSAVPGAVTLKGSFVVDREGLLHGIGGWCSAALSKTVTITNSPLDRDRINRRNVFFPIENPVKVAAGDVVDIEMHIRSAEIIFSWAIDVWQAAKGDRQTRVSKGSFRHSTFRGMPLSKEHFERTRPQFVPKLSSFGEARRSVLELCNGERPLAEIESEIYRRYAGLFHTYQQAAAFVAEVTTRYAI